MSVSFSEVSFARPGQDPILDGFDLAVDEGEIVAIVGRSGAGKTTILKLVNRLLLPSSGAVLVKGRDTRAWDPIELRRRTGYVFQDVGLFPHLTVEENVRIVPRLEGWDAEAWGCSLNGAGRRVCRVARRDRPSRTTVGSPPIR